MNFLYKKKHPFTAGKQTKLRNCILQQKQSLLKIPPAPYIKLFSLYKTFDSFWNTIKNKL